MFSSSLVPDHNSYLDLRDQALRVAHNVGGGLVHGRGLGHHGPGHRDDDAAVDGREVIVPLKVVAVQEGLVPYDGDSDADVPGVQVLVELVNLK